MFKIDLHVHSRTRSACGLDHDDDMIAAARESGLDAIAFADHNRLVPFDRIDALNEMYAPFRVYGAIEVNILDEHFLVYGIQDSRLELLKWTYADLHSFVAEKSGYFVLAHPYRGGREIRADIENMPPHGIEIHSRNTPPEQRERIQDLADRLGIHTFSNSDGHGVRSLGGFFNVFERMPEDDADLVAILKTGTVKPAMCGHGASTAASSCDQPNDGGAR